MLPGPFQEDFGGYLEAELSPVVNRPGTAHARLETQVFHLFGFQVPGPDGQGGHLRRPFQSTKATMMETCDFSGPGRSRS